MLTLYGRTDRVVTVRDEVLGRGGQGVVRPTENPPGHVVKFPTDRSQVEKAAVMVDIPAPEGCRSWPLDVLSRRPGGEPEAILMERVPGVNWFEFASPDARDRAGLRAVPADLRRGVRSLWREVAASHRVRVLVPDLHPANVLVDPAAGWAAQVIDRDSNEFEARDKNQVFRRFRCGVGLPGYLAPELVGKDLRATDRTPASDCFAAAVLSWEALKAGSHPFAWRNPSGGPVPDLGDAIRDRLWPFDPAVRPPAGCVPVDAGTPFAELPSQVRRLFHDTFAADPARRPTADQWVDALDAWAADGDRAALAAGVIRGAVGRVARHLARLNAL
ncbi:MAG: hypothetical protein K2X87_14425, partial [Gemmataceae bacterium]|nr:hypothetical protein [Gemmataceae bacterium]